MKNLNESDQTARQILADIAGMPIATSIKDLIREIVFGDEQK